jgi:hypothetical protein
VADVRDALVHLPDHGRAIQRGADVRIHVARGVVLAHPVVAIRVDAEAGEDVDEALRVVARVRGVAVGLLVGDVGEGAAHRLVHRVGRQERLGVHRVEVIDAVQERGLAPGGAQRPGDHVEDDRPAQAADVHGSGRRLGVVDDLRSGDPRGQLVRPDRRSDGRGRRRVGPPRASLGAHWVGDP